MKKLFVLPLILLVLAAFAPVDQMDELALGSKAPMTDYAMQDAVSGETLTLSEVAGENGLLGICYNPAPDEGAAGPRRDRVMLNRIAGFATGIQASAGSAYNHFVLNTIYYLVSPYEDLNGTNVFRRNRAMQIPPA